MPKEPAPKRVEVEVVKPATIKAIERAIDRCDAALARANNVAVRLHDESELAANRSMDLKACRDALVRELQALRPSAPPVSPRAEVVRQQQRTGTGKVTAIMVSRVRAEGLTEPQQAILDTVAMLDARGIRAERDTVARWLGIHPNGGSYGANLGHLRAEGFLEGFTLTERGGRAFRRQETGLEAALAALDGEPKRAILRTLIDAGKPLSREELAETLGLHPNGGSYGANLGWLRTMGLITERGPITTTEGLFR